MFGSQHLKVEYGLLIRLKLILLITELKNLTYIKRKDSQGLTMLMREEQVLEFYCITIHNVNI